MALFELRNDRNVFRFALHGPHPVMVDVLWLGHGTTEASSPYRTATPAEITRLEALLADGYVPQSVQA